MSGIRKDVWQHLEDYITTDQTDNTMIIIIIIIHNNLILKTGLSTRKMTKAINTFAVPVLWFSFGLIK